MFIHYFLLRLFLKIMLFSSLVLSIDNIPISNDDIISFKKLNFVYRTICLHTFRDLAYAISGRKYLYPTRSAIENVAKSPVFHFFISLLLYLELWERVKPQKCREDDDIRRNNLATFAMFDADDKNARMRFETTWSDGKFYRAYYELKNKSNILFLNSII